MPGAFREKAGGVITTPLAFSSWRRRSKADVGLSVARAVTRDLQVPAHGKFSRAKAVPFVFDKAPASSLKAARSEIHEV